MRGLDIPLTKRRLGALVVALLLLALTAGAIYRIARTGFDRQQFLRSFSQIDASYMLLGLFLVLLTYIGRAVRWRVMISPQRPNAKLGGLIRSTVIGFTAVTLFGRPGELVRPYLIAKKESLSVASQLAAWFLERIYDLLAVLVIFGIALTQVEPRPGLSEGLGWVLRTGGFLVGALGFVCVALLVATTFFSEAATRRIQEGLEVLPEKARERVQGIVAAFAGGMGCSRRGDFVFQIVLFTALEWMIIVAANYCIFRAFGPTSGMTITDTLVFLGFMAFGSVVQLPGIGGGMQVVSVIVLTEIFRVSLESATAVALLLWAALYVVVVPLGLAFAVLEGLSWRSLRHIQETDAPVELQK